MLKSSHATKWGKQLYSHITPSYWRTRINGSAQFPKWFAFENRNNINYTIQRISRCKVNIWMKKFWSNSNQSICWNFESLIIEGIARREEEEVTVCFEVQNKFFDRRNSTEEQKFRITIPICLGFDCVFSKPIMIHTLFLSMGFRARFRRF